MNTCVKKVLIIGGGFSGMSAAIELCKLNIDVDLVEIDPKWCTDGAGISVGGATLRAFNTLGILDEFMEHGSALDGGDVLAPDGTLLAQLPTPRVAGDDIPGSGAIMRPVLASILAEKTRAAGANVRLGCTFSSIKQSGDSVRVSFTEGSAEQYDLVIGADGLFSDVRKTVFPDAPKPRYSGQGVWRAVLPRGPEIKNMMMWVGSHLKVGVNPMSKDEMYLFLTENRAAREHIPSEQYVPMLKELMATFSAPLVQRIREQLTEDSKVMYRPLEGMLMPQPWYQGRVVLIGDTVHATTPHLASGACIGVEDAIVLAEELQRHDDIDSALQAFQSRRWERCRMVVENSGRLGQIEIEGSDKEEHTRIMQESMMAIAQPI